MGQVMRKRVLCNMRNNKGADQPAHPRSVISTFVFRCLDSTTPLLVIFEISKLQLASVAEQAGLNLTWSKISKDMFLRDVAQIQCDVCLNVHVFSESSLLWCGWTYSEYYYQHIQCIRNNLHKTSHLVKCVFISFCPCWLKMSHLMTKPAKWLCIQQRLRSAWHLPRVFVVCSVGS